MYAYHCAFSKIDHDSIFSIDRSRLNLMGREFTHPRIHSSKLNNNNLNDFDFSMGSRRQIPKIARMNCAICLYTTTEALQRTNNGKLDDNLSLQFYNWVMCAGVSLQFQALPFVATFIFMCCAFWIKKYILPKKRCEAGNEREKTELKSIFIWANVYIWCAYGLFEWIIYVAFDISIEK